MNRKAFTLIELLVVVAIIGILAAVGVVAYNGYTGGAKEKSLRTIHKNLVKLMVYNKALCEVQDSHISLYKSNNINIWHWCGMDASTAQSQYVSFLVYSGWKNPYDNSYPASDGKPGKTGISTRCCNNGKKYLEVISFTTKTEYFTTKIMWD